MASGLNLDNESASSSNGSTARNITSIRFRPEHTQQRLYEDIEEWRDVKSDLTEDREEERGVLMQGGGDREECD